MASTGEPARYAPAHLLLRWHEIFRCQRDRLGKEDLPVSPATNTPSITQQWKVVKGSKRLN
jgi:hypothetical protein